VKDDIEAIKVIANLSPGLEDFLIRIGWKTTGDKTTVKGGYVLVCFPPSFLLI
jgi:hypothetical protein